MAVPEVPHEMTFFRGEWRDVRGKKKRPDKGKAVGEAGVSAGEAEEFQVTSAARRTDRDVIYCRTNPVFSPPFIDNQ